MPAKPPVKICWWYEAIVDWQLIHPDGKLYQCAEELNVSGSWLSTIINSDAFKELKESRRQELNSSINSSITGKLETIAHTSLEELQTRIDDERAKLTLGQLQDVAGLTLKAMGFGAKGVGDGRGGNQTNHVQINNFGAVTKEALESARAKMRGTTAVDVTPIEVEGDGTGTDSGDSGTRANSKSGFKELPAPEKVSA